MAKFYHGYYKVMCEWESVQCDSLTLDILLIWKDTPTNMSSVSVREIYDDSVTLHRYQDSSSFTLDLIGLAILSKEKHIEELKSISYLTFNNKD